MYPSPPHTTTPLLEPLDDMPFSIPFPEEMDVPSVPGALGLFHAAPLFRDTPSSVECSLPTPTHPAINPFQMEIPRLPVIGFGVPTIEEEAVEVPQAPILKDMDSFSDGTAPGSFNFSLVSGGCDAPSVAFSPSHPSRSIEVWREDVRRCVVQVDEDGPEKGGGSVREEPAAKRRRLSNFPQGEDDKPMTASAVGRSQSLPPISFCLPPNDDSNHSAVHTAATMSRPPSAPPALS